MVSRLNDTLDRDHHKTIQLHVCDNINAHNNKAERVVLVLHITPALCATRSSICWYMVMNDTHTHTLTIINKGTYYAIISPTNNA